MAISFRYQLRPFIHSHSLSTQVMIRLSFLFLLVAIRCLRSSDAFVPSSPSVSSNRLKQQIGMLTDPAAIEEMESARFAFWMCFYGAAGVGSIGRELIPIVFGRYTSTKALGTSAGVVKERNEDEDLGIWGYPEKITKKDVENILKNPLSPEAIARKYPIEKEEGAEERYKYTHIDVVPSLSYDAFVRANPRANPVALRAVFDSFSNSIGGSNSVSPITAQINLDIYKSNVKAMTKKLNNGKILGLAAFFGVLVLLGIADWLAIFHIWRGWFPEWQGFSDLPGSLFDADTGLRVLPEYFVN